MFQGTRGPLEGSLNGMRGGGEGAESYRDHSERVTQFAAQGDKKQKLSLLLS